MADVTKTNVVMSASSAASTRGAAHDQLSVRAGSGATAAATPAVPDYADTPRATWLPSNFKKPEDLVASYKELQAAFTKSQQELAAQKGGAPSTPATTTSTAATHPLAVPPAPAPDLQAIAAAAVTGTPAAPTAATGSTPAASPPGSPAPSSPLAVPPTPLATPEPIDPVDLKALSKEFAQNGGKLTDASIARLSKKGIDPGTIAIFVEGQEALSEKYTKSIVEAAGGKDRLDLVLKWHSQTAAESGQRYNQALADADWKGATLIMAGMSAAYQEAVGRDPKLAISGVEARKMATEEPFTSMPQLVAAQNDRRYGKDMDYTQMVVRRGMGLARLQRAGQAR